MEASAIAWPATAAVLSAAGTAVAFLWHEYKASKDRAAKQRQERLDARRVADEARRSAELDDAKRIRVDFETMRADYNQEFLRLRGRVAELEKESTHDRQLLAAAQRVNEDLMTELVRLRAEVQVLRTAVDGKVNIKETPA